MVRSFQPYYTTLLLFFLLSLVYTGHSSPIIKKQSNNPYSKTQYSTSSTTPRSTSSTVTILPSESEKVVKRSAGGGEEEEYDENYEESPQNYQNVQPMIISKKSANALNKLVTALRNSMDSGNINRNSDYQLREKEMIPMRNNPNYEMFNLQRRNQNNRKNYLRCYFNAVSCF